MKRWCLAILFAGAAHAADHPAVVAAQQLYQAGDYAGARIEFKKLLASGPDHVAALYFLGKIAVHQGDYPGAIQLLERATALAPGESDYFLWLGNAEAWAAATAPYGDRTTLGRKCLEAYRKALELNPDNLPAHFSLMNFYRHVPAIFGGGSDRAYAEAEAIRQRNPTQGAYALAVLWVDEKKYAQAFATYSGILRSNPDDYAANCALGALAVTTGTHLDEGAACFRHCLEICPAENDQGHEFAHWGLGRISEIKHETPAARLAYETCLKLNPRFKPAEEALARLQ